MFTPRQPMFATPKATPSSSRPRSARTTPTSRRSSFLPALNRGRTPNRSQLNTSSHYQSLLQSSHIIEETENHLVEAFGSTLPVAITEILTLSERTTDVSVNLSPNGWAWLVHGRRLIVWRYSKSSSNKPFSANCRELTLPPSDLAHNAKLVNVFAANENQTPSCIAVSPEGIVRFWPSIAHSGSSYEINSDLQGQECYSLSDIQPLGSILTTTTATVVLIYHGNSGGHHSIACRTLKPPQGILGGIGRRVSSLLWGGMATGSSTEAKLVQVLGTRSYCSSGMEDPFEKIIYVLTSNGFQKWLLTQGEPDKMFYNCDLESIAKQAFATHLWAQENPDPSWIKIWLLDMQLVGHDAVSVLMAAYNPHISQQLYYAIGVINTMSNASPIQFKSVTILNYNVSYNSDNQDANNSQTVTVGCDLKFLLPDSSGHNVGFIYNGNTVICAPCTGGSSASGGELQEVEQLDFGNGGNAILGAGYSSDGHALFFSVTHGMITIQPSHQPALDKSNLTFNDSIAADKATRLSESLNLSVSQAGLDNLTMSESRKDQLKAAFLLFCKRNFGQSTSIVEEMFPLSNEMANETDSALDRLVVSMSADLIDDFPASDPRWLKTVPGAEAAGGVGSTMSLLILHQLEDKQTALEVYISFLKEVGLWRRLTGVCTKELIMATSLILCEHMEKTVATITLRTIHAEHSSVVDEAIKQTLKHRQKSSTVDTTEDSLTPQDHFYREISRVEEIVNGFQIVSEKASNGSWPPREVVAAIFSINNIILTMFKEVAKSRNDKKDDFESAATKFEYLPWTSTPGPQGLRTLLMRQFHLTLDKVVPLVEDSGTKVDFYQQCLELADFVLDGYKAQIETIQNVERRKAVLKQYEKDRADLILPLVSKGCYEEATSLGEKYLEFNALVKICELTDDNDRLERYMDIFSEHNFSNFVFDWHVREGKQARLLTQNYSGSRNNQLGQYLKGHSELSWMHEIETQNYSEATATLKALAYNETGQMSQKKTLLSLAKLSMLASDVPTEVAEIELRSIEYDLNIILAQEQLPACILESYGFNPQSMRPLTARELIELYIGDDNSESDQVDFKKALDLVEYIAPLGGNLTDLEAEREAVRLKIWARSVLKDSWLTLNTDEPIEAIKDTVFFKLVEFCYIQGLDLKENMPAPDRLLEADELEHLKSNANFQFLLRTGYEHVRRHCSSEDQQDDSMLT